MVTQLPRNTWSMARSKSSLTTTAPSVTALWDFKLNHPSCSECGATMGREVKLLLDTDVCPFCEEGKVSLTVPVCAKCGQRIDPGIVVWG